MTGLKLAGEVRVDELPQRLASRIRVDGATGCWLWTGWLNLKGYGQVRFGPTRGGGRGAPQRNVHRVVYELLVGPLADDLKLDHVVALCRFRRCVNPGHMEPVSHQVNTLRGSGPTAINARKTHCVHGHEFTPENTAYRRDGWRRCRVCRRDESRRRRPRNRSAA